MGDLFLAVGGFIGAMIATAVAIVSAAKENQKVRRTLIAFAVGGLVVSAICACLQYTSARETTKNWNDTKTALNTAQSTLLKTKEELDKAKQVLDAASISVDDLAQLNELSSGHFYVQLSVDSRVCLPCSRARGIDHQFPGALANQGIRVINVGGGNQPYHLIFGKKLSLAAAGIYQRLAIDHNLANGRPLIENETGNELVINCMTACPGNAHQQR